MFSASVRHTAVFLLSIMVALIPTVAAYQLFLKLSFTDTSSLFLAGGVGVLFGMATAALLVAK